MRGIAAAVSSHTDGNNRLSLFSASSIVPGTTWACVSMIMTSPSVRHTGAAVFAKQHGAAAGRTPYARFAVPDALDDPELLPQHIAVSASPIGKKGKHAGVAVRPLRLGGTRGIE